MWILSSDKMPKDLEVVIGLYRGVWPCRGNGGITDVYAVNGNWFNVPEGVEIVAWMPNPDTRHLPEHVSRQRSALDREFLGFVDTDGFYEGFYEGDFSKIDAK